MTTEQRNYFIDAIAAGDPEEPEEMLVGCRMHGERAMYLSLRRARLWIADHHADCHEINDPVGADLIGDFVKTQQKPTKHLVNKTGSMLSVIAAGHRTAPEMLQALDNWSRSSVSAHIRQLRDNGTIRSIGKRGGTVVWALSDEQITLEELDA